MIGFTRSAITLLVNTSARNARAPENLEERLPTIVLAVNTGLKDHSEATGHLIPANTHKTRNDWGIARPFEGCKIAKGRL